jgi:TfoX/Sxy family transcriptional regulator of competence genes
MGYDEALAGRVRRLLAGQDGITEKAMFGGLAFLAEGHMAVAVSSRGVLMLRADEEMEARLLERSGVEQTVMRGRPMSGWLDVDTALLEGDALRDVVTSAVAHARSLPPR